jgi:hypothetical protein
MSRDILRLPSDDFERSLNPKGMFVRREGAKECRSSRSEPETRF